MDDRRADAVPHPQTRRHRRHRPIERTSGQHLATISLHLVLRYRAARAIWCIWMRLAARVPPPLFLWLDVCCSCWRLEGCKVWVAVVMLALRFLRGRVSVILCCFAKFKSRVEEDHFWPPSLPLVFVITSMIIWRDPQEHHKSRPEKHAFVLLNYL